MKSNKLKIDTLRGLACVLLVAYHVIGSEATNGLRISAGAIRDVNDILAYIRMPLFTFLSGLVYAYRPFREGAKDFMLKKARRLLVPMLFVGTIFALLQYFTPGSNASIESWYLLHIIPVAHFWFLESLFLIFLLIVALEVCAVFGNVRGWAATLLAASLLYLSPLASLYFSFSGFLYLLPFFLFGMGIQRYDLLQYINKAVAMVGLLLTATILLLTYADVIPLYGRRELPSLLIGFVACVGLLSLAFESKLLAKLGAFSYSIYLFHVFFTAFTRIVLNKVGVELLWAVFTISLIAGLIGPMVADRVLTKFSLLRVLFLGKSPIKSVATESNRLSRNEA